MRIDAHNHPDWYGYTVEKFVENMKKNNIDKTWLLSWETKRDEFNPNYLANIPEALDGEYAIEFKRCIKYKEKYPDKFILGYAPDPRTADAIDKLDFAISMYDVKVYGELKLRMMYDNPDAIRMFRFCGEKGLPVIMHYDYELREGNKYPRPNYWYGGGIEAFERVLIACPNTIFLGHAPGFWSHISGDDLYKTESYPKGKVMPGGKIPYLLEKYPNLYCDMSAGSGCNALSRDLEFGREFIIKYQDRILYSRDYFDNIHQEMIEKYNFSNEVKEKLYYKNAQKLIGV